MKTHTVTIKITVRGHDDRNEAYEFGRNVREHLLETFNDDDSIDDIEIDPVIAEERRRTVKKGGTGNV